MAASLAVAVTIGCSAPTAAAPGIIAVKQASTVRAPRFDISLDHVESDSRCPVDVTCVWTGNAKVGIKLQLPNTRYAAPTQFVNTHVDPRSIDFNGVRITLDSLLPHPHSGVTIPPSAYVAYFSATKIGN